MLENLILSDNQQGSLSVSIGTSRDYPEREYGQATGSARRLIQRLVDDIVRSLWRHRAVRKDGAGNSEPGLNTKDQVTDLRTDAGSGQWLDIQKAALSGGNESRNAIYSDALGEYNNVILRKANHVTQGVHSTTGAPVTTVRRAVLLGAQSAAVAFGKNNGPTTYNWNEELIDHKRKLEVSMLTMWGLKKTKYDSQDFGAVVVSSYAAAHTS